jgi:two-component system, cell cycle sensor histidine kinase and response regulator CckA
LEKSLEEIIGANIFKFFSPEVAARRFALFQQILATGQPAGYEESREEFHFIEEITPIVAQGKVAQVAVLAVDITGRKKMEEALRESEARFKALFDHAPVGIAMIDLNGQFRQTNQSLQAFLGYDDDELMRLNFQEVSHPEDHQENLRFIKELRDGDRWLVTVERRLLRKDGSEFWGQVVVALVRDARWAPQYLIATVINISLQKQAAEELRESEERFRLMAESSTDIFWIGTPGLTKITYVSPGYDRIWGRPREELYQSIASFTEAIHPEDRERVRADIIETLARGLSWSHEYRIIRPDGSLRWVQDRGVQVQGEQGDVILITGVVADITERKTLEQQLVLAQKMEAVGRLAGGVAHDFNNLLMAITGYGELVSAKVPKEDPIYDYLQDILKAADRAADLTKQLLTFSRRQIVHPQVLDLNRVIQDLEGMLRRLLGEDVDLEIETDPNLGAVEVDPGQISQIIMNLVVNARDAMPQGGRLSLKTASVKLWQSCQASSGTVPPGAYVLVMVQDSGTGMDEATQAHIFEPFFSTKEPGKGTGLGLSTVYGIVKQSGGYIDLVSQPGAGSLFTIYLPRLEATPVPPKIKLLKELGLRGKETILLVEDEDVLRGLLAKFLRLYGYAVLEARNGGEALLTCERHPGPIHLMVTDVVMPQMSGRELADRLAPLRPEMGVIYVSGYTEDAVVQHGVTAQAVSFLQKPFKPLDLVRLVHGVLQGPENP